MVETGKSVRVPLGARGDSNLFLNVLIISQQNITDSQDSGILLYFAWQKPKQLMES